MRDTASIATVRALVSESGYGFPDLDGCLDRRDEDALSEYPFALRRVVIAHDAGEGNVVLIHPDQPRGPDQPISVRFFGSGCVLVIGPRCLGSGLIRMHADNSICVFAGDNVQPAFLSITHWSKGTTSFIGRRTTSNGAQLVLMGEDARIVVREDCMFSTGIWVKTSDMHAIVDIETGDMVNADPSGGTIEIERHVWLGQDALVVNPLTVGAGAIIGARSFLNRSVPPKTLWAGTPARQLREGVTWLRSHLVLAEELEDVRATLAQSNL